MLNKSRILVSKEQMYIPIAIGSANDVAKW